MDEAGFKEKRKFKRFFDRSFSWANIELRPVPPLFGEPARGMMVDLSAGGMALLLSEIIPKNLLLKMVLVFKDGSKVESVVRINRVTINPGGGYLHGIQFLSLSPEDIERIESMAVYSLACDERIKNNEPDICISGCPFNSLCSKPQRFGGERSPSIIEFKPVESAVFANYRKKFKKLRKAA